jgi:hypothetical protein
VKNDPRFNIPQSVIDQRYVMLKDLQNLTAMATKATDRLIESLAITDEYEKKMKESKRTDLKEPSEKTKVMRDSVNALFDFILGKEDKRQGLKVSPIPTPASYIQTARNYIATSNDPVGETDKRVFKHADDKINGVLNRVNKFYATTWPAYRTMMEKVALSPFKDYEPIKK